MSTNWCKNMSYSAKKAFTNPIGVLFLGLFVLAGCQVDGTLTVDDEEDSQTEQTDQKDGSNQDDTQETASESGSEDSLASEDDDAEDGSGEESSQDDGTQEESSADTGSGEETVDNMATLMWDAPAERENGDSLKVGEIDHYIVSWGQDPEELENTEEIPCETCADMEHVIEDLDEGTWYFTVQTQDTEGNVSRQADPESKNI